MEENKKHIDAKEFFKLMDADNNQDLSHLDEFEKEALEGLKMMKDRSKLENVNARIDEKLEELIAEDKKGKSRTGLYFLSIAASIVLVLGLFFIFKKSDINKEVAQAKEETGKDLSAPAPPPALESSEIEKKLEEKISDAEVPPADKNISAAKDPKPAMGPPPVYEPGLANSEGMLKQKNEIAVPMEQNLEYDQDGKRADNIISQDDNIVKADMKDRQEQMVVSEEKAKVTADNISPTTTNTGSTALYTTTPAYSNASGTGNVTLNKSNGDYDGTVKGKKKEAKKDAGKFNYKSGEAVPSMDEVTTKTQNTSINNPAGIVSPNNNNSNTAYTAVVTDNKKEDEKSISKEAVSEAEFVGGKTALDAYIKKNLIIPASCPEEEVVIVRFTIDEQGNVSKPKVVSKTGNCHDCEKEAIRFVKAMPTWIAATTKGKPFTSQKTLMLSFRK